MWRGYYQLMLLMLQWIMLTLILSFSLLPRVSFNAFNSVSVYTLSKNDACITLSNVIDPQVEVEVDPENRTAA